MNKIIALLLFSSAFTAQATPLVTGNGRGFAIVQESGELTKFYAHPYRFEKPDPQYEFGEGIETANFISSLYWKETNAAPLAMHTKYSRESNIVVVDTFQSHQNFWMPFSLDQNVLIASRQSVSGQAAELSIQWANEIETTNFVSVNGKNIEVLSFKQVKERLLKISLAHDLIAFVAVEDKEDIEKIATEIFAWQKNLSADQLIARELQQIEAWRVQPPHFNSAAERKVWRQSEIVLRMAQIREQNRPGRYGHGLILASLPEGMWFVSWVRDMAYAAIALIRMGHQAEARAAIEAYFNARPIGRMTAETRNLPYQISVVRYFGDGSEEPYFTMEGWPNVEFDNWGLVLWVLGEYVERFHDTSILNTPTYRGRIYDSAKNFVAKPLLGNLDPYGEGNIVAADTSIWEEPQDAKKHFAYTNIAAIQGLKKFRALAHEMKDSSTETQLSKQIPLLQKGFDAAFTSQGWIRGTLEESFKNEIDGAVLESIYLEVATDSKVSQKTLEQMELLKMPSGGYRRVRGDTDYEKQEFLFINFSLADIYERKGNRKRAEELFRPMTEKAARDHGFVPEMYVSELNDQFPGEIGTPTGSIPMVGYGAGIFIRHILERDAATKKLETP